jgi:hypothetical protein
MLVGMVSTTGQWWLDTRKPAKDIVAAHLCNLAWNGLSGLDPQAGTRHPTVSGRRLGPAGAEPGHTPRPPTTSSSTPSNSPVSIGIASAMAAFTLGSCNESA